MLWFKWIQKHVENKIKEHEMRNDVKGRRGVLMKMKREPTSHSLL